MAWQWDLLPVATGIFGVDGQYDFVRATFTDGSNVPRMPPMRVGGGTYWRNDNWFVRMGLLHAFGQSDLGQNDTPTAGYNLLKMEISNKQYWRDSPWGAAEITTGLVGDNLLDVDVRNSVQFHKDEILMPGRSIKFFMNAKFGGVPPVTKAGYYKAPTGFGGTIFKAPVLTRLDLGRPLYRRQHRLQRRQVQDRRGLQRSRHRRSCSWPTGSTDNLNGSDRRHPGRLQLAVGAIGWAASKPTSRSRAKARTPSYLCPGAVCNPGIADFDAPVTATFDQGHKLDSFGTLRGRFGTTITPDVMVYATGGLAVGSIRSTVRLAGVGFDADGNPGAVSNAVSVLTQKAGWTVGAGLEGRLFGNVTGKIEYLYMDFGTISTSVTNPFNATPVTLSSNSRITDNIVRVGLNYKLDPAIGIYDVLAGVGAPSVYKALPTRLQSHTERRSRPRGPGPVPISA